MPLRRGIWIPWALLIAHLSALTFGLIGILYVMPNLADFASNPDAMRVYDWSLRNAGSTHIVFGAAAVFAFGVYAIGWSKTLLFLLASCVISLSAELLGTTSGWPFGPYSYTNYLGWKVGGHVPFSIPLSWFYIGFSCYLLSSVLVAALGLKRQTLMTILGGAWFLTVWDLVLDPAMAHESLPIKFWNWGTDGVYYGMPIKNFIGWTVTGLIFMSVARLLWREDVDGRRIPTLFPYVTYLSNTVFAMFLSASVGLWIPIILAALLGVIPTGFVLFLNRDRSHAGAALFVGQPLRSSPSD